MLNLTSLRQDVRHGFRVLRKYPAVTTVALLTLTLVLGASTAVFSVMHGVLLKALPYSQPSRIYEVGLWTPPQEGRPGGRSYPDARMIEAWQGQSRTAEHVAVYSPRAMTLTGRGDPVRLQGAAVSPELFSLLGVTPRHGRTFRAEEAQRGVTAVVILGHDLWQRRFEGDARIVDRVVTLDGVGHTVVGVMPESFFFPSHETAFWILRAVGAGSSVAEGFLQVEYVPAIARLREGVSPEQAAAEAQVILEGSASIAGRSEEDVPAGRVELTPLRDAMVAEARPALLAMFAAVGLVLLIACANLANLLLARNAAREREMAVRLAMGGERKHLVRQILIESLVLSGLGGVLGFLVALGLLRLIPSLVPAGIPRVEEVGPDARVFLFAFLVAGLTGLLFGLLPAFRSTRSDLVRPLHGGSPRMSGSVGPRSLLVVAETALAFVLLVGAGLLLSSYLGLVSVDPGFRPDGVLTSRLEPERQAFFDHLLSRLEDHPEVQAAGVVSVLPPARGFSLTSFDLPDLPPARTLAVPQWTSPGYFEALGMRWVEGRGLTREEHARRAPVVVVNEALVRKFFAGTPAVGRNLVLQSTPLEILGVVADVRLSGLDADPRPEIYVSYRLAESLFGSPPEGLFLAIKARNEPESLIPFLRSTVGEIDPTVPLEDLRTLATRLSASVAEPRFYASLLGGFALLALVLTAAGIFGILADFVTRRTRRIGIERALGAPRGIILKMILGRAVSLVLLGFAVGLGVVWAATRVLGHLLPSIVTSSVSTCAWAALLLLGVALVACYLPARRALRVDPLVALRHE